MEKKQSNVSQDYDQFAERYAANVDQKPIHLFYERPNTWSLLPSTLTNLKILDVGCGSGWYAEQLVKAGATVTAIDANAKMVELTQARIKNHGTCIKANLENALPFFTGEFDIILAPLVIHYIENWQRLFTEFSRILKSHGLFIFSTHQPHTEFFNFKLNNYFEKQIVQDHWQDINADVRFYHHTLHELMDALYNAGFIIERLLEPFPSDALKQDQRIYNLIVKQPWFLFVRASKK